MRRDSTSADLLAAGENYSIKKALLDNLGGFDTICGGYTTSSQDLIRQIMTVDRQLAHQPPYAR